MARNRMTKETMDDPTIKIPKEFVDFVSPIKKVERGKGQFVDVENESSLMYFSFCESLLDYCRELFRLESKQRNLEEEAKSRGLPVPLVLPSEKKKLHEKAKRMSLKYS